MRKILVGAFIFALSLVNAQKTSEKVVMSSSGEVVGTYVKESSTQYLVSGQDDIWVPKRGHRVASYSAAKGQGYIFPKNEGKVNVRQQPSLSSKVIGGLFSEDGYAQEPAECLGYANGWFKTRVNGVVGYVWKDNVRWVAFNEY